MGDGVHFVHQILRLGQADLHGFAGLDAAVQLAGQKHFILFPPSQARRLYRIPGVAHCQFEYGSTKSRMK